MLPIRPVDIRDEVPPTEISEELVGIFNDLINDHYLPDKKYSTFSLKTTIETIKRITDQYVLDIPDVLYPKLKEVYGKAGWSVDLRRDINEKIRFYFSHC